MALVQIRIGDLIDIQQYDDGDYDSAIETTEPIKVGTPIDPNDALRLDSIGGLGLATEEFVLNSIGVVLGYWFQVISRLGTSYYSAITYGTETIVGTPQTLTSANTFFKADVVDVPTPFTIKDGVIILTHIQAKVTTATGRKPTTLHTELWYMDADGTSNQVQIGADSEETPILTTTKTLYESHIHVTVETTVPAGKRLWVKIVATTTGALPNPIVWIYQGDVHDHLNIPVSGSVLSNYVQVVGAYTELVVTPGATSLTVGTELNQRTVEHVRISAAGAETLATFLYGTAGQIKTLIFEGGNVSLTDGTRDSGKFYLNQLPALTDFTGANGDILSLINIDGDGLGAHGWWEELNRIVKVK